MKITHNIAFSVDERLKRKFAEFGIDLDIGFDNFKICESDSRWSDIKELTTKKLQIFQRAEMG
ncbi:MAG: hypothetical protein P8X89_02555 [Reinekea sp.]